MSALLLAQILLVAPLVCTLGGTVLSILLRRRIAACLALGYGAAMLGGTLAVAAGLGVLLGMTPTPTVRLLVVMPGAALALHLTPLSAAFWVVAGLPVAAVSIYAWGYARHAAAQAAHRVALLGALFNLFIASLLLVLAATNALGFLVVWEAMALFSYLLVVYDYHDRAVVRAGLIYAVMTHAGTACIILCFLVLASAAPGGALTFDALAAGGHHLGSGSASLAFLLALLGFGTKAGVMPLHVWLPRAHPVAPSHVSALMSGVMIKTGIYGLVLVWFTFLPSGPLWWGLLVLALGAISAFLGVLYALMQHDLKRLLAYHSVENIGIILLALGAALLLRSSGQPALAALALAAALFHTLNHAVFKSLLFMGAGAIQNAAHTRDLEHLGGLIHRMPQTAAFFLVGAAAIIGLPPLNGFASEWLVYQSLLAVGLHESAAGVGGAALLAGSVLGLTGALAAACFVKATGIPFLGQPRGKGAAAAQEAGRPERAGMALLAVACLGLGLLPLTVLHVLRPVTMALVGQAPVALSGGAAGWLGAVAVPGMRVRTALQPLAPALTLLGLTLLTFVLARSLGLQRRAVRRVRATTSPQIGADTARAPTPLPRSGAPAPTATRIGPTWNCGVGITPRMQYTATSFAQPIRRMFSAIVQPDRTQEVRYAHAPYFVEAITHDVSLKPIFARLLYRPLHRAFLRLVAVVRLVQNGSVHAYLAYVFVALVIVLMVTR